MQPKIYTNEELTDIVDKLKKRIRNLEKRNDEEWAKKVAKRSGKIF